MPTCDDLRSIVSEFSLIEECDIMPGGTLRASTAFKYPDGSQIDIFIVEQNQRTLRNEITVTDLGQTTAYLLDLSVRHWTTKRRKQLIGDVCAALRIELDGGELKIRTAINAVPDAIVRLAQACIRVADLAYTQRLRTETAFDEEFEEFIAATGFAYEAPAVFQGRYDNPVKVDYKVIGPRRKTLIQTLSSANAYAARDQSLEMMARWYDLEPLRKEDQFLTVYDSGTNGFRGADIRRLSDFAAVLAFPVQQDKIRELLAA